MRAFHGLDVTGMWAAVKREQAAKKAMGEGEGSGNSGENYEERYVDTEECR